MPIEVPQMTDVDVTLGNINAMPAYEDIPAEFKKSNNPWVKLVENIFYNGLKKQEVDKLLATAKDKKLGPAVLRCLKAWLRSFAPQHERKLAAAAMLLSENFRLHEKG